MNINLHRDQQYRRSDNQQGIKSRNLESTKVIERSSLTCSCLSDNQHPRLSELQGNDSVEVSRDSSVQRRADLK